MIYQSLSRISTDGLSFREVGRGRDPTEERKPNSMFGASSDGSAKVEENVPKRLKNLYVK